MKKEDKMKKKKKKKEKKKKKKKKEEADSFYFSCGEGMHRHSSVFQLKYYLKRAASAEQSAGQTATHIFPIATTI